MQTERRSHWGWGYSDPKLPESLVTNFKSMVQAVFELDELSEITPPAIDNLNLRLPRFKMPVDLTGFCTEADYDRASHTYGKAFRDVIRGIYGQFDNPPDYVAYPNTEADIQTLMTFCMDKSIALVPYGGGSSVVGGVEQPDTEGYNGSISCDMCRFDQILAIHPLSRAATIQAGIYGPALEAGLKPHGLTLRHYPQSFEFSTLGGWIATRAGGHFATLYTHIDEMVEAIRMITPQGIFETRMLPGTGDGPDANRLLIGSEGVFGIITQATMRLQASPTIRASASVSFINENDGIQAVRLISQWDAIKAKASETIIKHGGPITHHHAVGRVHRPWYEKSRPALYGPILTNIKKTLDPRWILNPEVLIAPPDKN